jgi:hypothetical protein
MGLNIIVIMSLFMLPLSGWLCHSSKLTKIIKNPNTYSEGIKKFQSIIRGKDPNLARFKKHLGNRSTGQGIEIDANECSGEEGNESEDM